ncbi:type II secretion system GspH family protein [Geobacter pelophilus]|jgi:general secretion pathway protein H|uniref:Type II secretion system GspH family protein n=1 Tax=Geoanaerobacter pelophilus TaxID=60036 RepID=A0AAW4L3A6_9BACT|nr:type II secretion system protein [Geoanaerobacter pelophilus]MBT0664032.1 type II secretion system GspH family protein [Geoanaerobacter pelophilus]
MKHSQGGFTLIEMVVVLVILAMTMLLVLPRLPDTSGAALKRSARTLASTMRYVRDQVTVTRLVHRLRFLPGEGKITITTLPPGGTETSSQDPFLNRQILVDGVTVSDIEIPRLGKVSSGELIIDIGPAGVADITLIHLKGAEGRQMTVTAFPYGGQVKVEEGYREISQ